MRLGRRWRVCLRFVLGDFIEDDAVVHYNHAKRFKYFLVKQNHASRLYNTPDLYSKVFFLDLGLLEGC
mgnify:CR=1 FL=1